ncbi:hypothetical protein NMY22_g1477 [Coprinellus aureogranulatus]|nr:hypothetical protein NMY22_g1477 [Coprinellus aureogranulatus]
MGLTSLPQSPSQTFTLPSPHPVPHCPWIRTPPQIRSRSQPSPLLKLRFAKYYSRLESGAAIALPSGPPTMPALTVIHRQAASTTTQRSYACTTAGLQRPGRATTRLTANGVRPPLRCPCYRVPSHARECPKTQTITNSAASSDRTSHIPSRPTMHSPTNLPYLKYSKISSTERQSLRPDTVFGGVRILGWRMEANPIHEQTYR